MLSVRDPWTVQAMLVFSWLSSVCLLSILGLDDPDLIGPHNTSAMLCMTYNLQTSTDFAGCPKKFLFD